MIDKQQFINSTDEELVQKSLLNSDYFGILVDRYEQKFLRYIGRLLGRNSSDIEDILQDVFIKIYEHLNDFDTNLKFSSWGYRIARNETIDKIRHLNQTRIIKLNDLELEEIADKINLIDDLDNKILKQKILTALNTLKPKYQEPLILLLLEEKSYEEISDILRKPVGTVGSLINRGKEKLKNLIK